MQGPAASSGVCDRRVIGLPHAAAALPDLTQPSILADNIDAGISSGYH